jgi:hypothetical protein
MMESKRLVGIFSGGYPESMILKSLLESHGITVHQENFIMSTMYPGVVSMGGFAASILKIDNGELEKAKEILQDYDIGK